jgi:hypothetical protein
MKNETQIGLGCLKQPPARSESYLETWSLITSRLPKAAFEMHGLSELNLPPALSGHCMFATRIASTASRTRCRLRLIQQYLRAVFAYHSTLRLIRQYTHRESRYTRTHRITRPVTPPVILTFPPFTTETTARNLKGPLAGGRRRHFRIFRCHRALGGFLGWHSRSLGRCGTLLLFRLGGRVRLRGCRGTLCCLQTKGTWSLRVCRKSCWLGEYYDSRGRSFFACRTFMSRCGHRKAVTWRRRSLPSHLCWVRAGR